MMAIHRAICLMIWVQVSLSLSSATENDESDSTMPVTITGKIIFPSGSDVTFPPGSYLHVSCDDTSRMDAPSINLGSAVVDVSGKSTKDELRYTITAAEFSNNGYGVSMSATINVGWKRAADGDEWIRKGDYLNDTSHPLGVKEEGATEYEMDIAVIHYNH